MKTLFATLLAALGLLSAAAWWMTPGGDPGGRIQLVWVSDENPTRRDQMRLFNESSRESVVRLDPNNTGIEKVIVQSLAGVGPDLFDCYDQFQLSAYVKSGVALDVTDFLAESGVRQEDLWSGGTAAFRFENRVYGFPTNVASNAIWYHREILRRAGIRLPKGPWKWDALVPLAKRLTIRDTQGKVLQYGLVADSWNWPQFVMQWGGRVYSEDGTRCVADSPEAIAGLRFYRDLIYVHRVMPSPVEEAAMATAGGWGSGTITQFGAKRAAMALGGRWWLNTLRAYKGLDLGVAECPHQVRRVFRAYGRATLVNANSPNRDAALRFLLYEAGPAYNRLINDQADGIAPVRKYAYSPDFLHNPAFPNETDNAVWRESMRCSEPDATSPFVNGAIANRIFMKQIDLVKANQKSPEEAMRTAARLVNEEIQKTLKQDPELAGRYRELTGRTSP